MGNELVTSRLRLRPCGIRDLESLHDLWTNDRVRHFLFDDRMITLDEARSFVEASEANFEERNFGLWLVFADAQPRLVGFAGFLLSDETPSLIYGIHPDFWGQGYATEAARAVLHNALQLGLRKVRADVDEPNVLSIRVLEKLGMEHTGRAIVAGRTLLYFEQSSLPVNS